MSRHCWTWETLDVFCVSQRLGSKVSPNISRQTCFDMFQHRHASPNRAPSPEHYVKSRVRHILQHRATGVHRSRGRSKRIEPILQHRDQQARQSMPQNKLCTVPANLACHLDVSIHPGFLPEFPIRACCIRFIDPKPVTMNATFWLRHLVRDKVSQP